MRYLKTFENVSVLNSYIQDIRDILLELSDENWIINVRYIAKRWDGNNRIKCDYINVAIKKKQNKSSSLYPEGSEFEFSEISEYVYRIIDYFMTDDYSFKVCRKAGKKPVDGTIFPENTGIWLESDIPNIDDNILGIELHIYLQGENIDGFKYQDFE